jgi:ribosomal protein L21E
MQQFKIGDRVRVKDNPYSQHSHAGKTGTVTAFQSMATLKREGKDSEGYYTVKWDDAPMDAYTPGIWDINLTAHNPFKVGDKVRFIKHARYIPTVSRGEKFYNGHVGETATVEAPLRYDSPGGVRVRYDAAYGQDGNVDPSCLELAKPTTYKVGDRIVFTSSTGKEYPGTVVDPTEKGARIGRVVLDEKGHYFRTDLTLSSLKPEPKPKRTFEFAVGDKVTTVSVTSHPQRAGKPATVVALPRMTDRYRVKFADGLTLYATVKAAPSGKERLSGEILAARVALGKLEKLERLAGELGYSISKIDA